MNPPGQSEQIGNYEISPIALTSTLHDGVLLARRISDDAVFVSKKVVKWRLTHRGLANLSRGLRLHQRLLQAGVQGIVPIEAILEKDGIMYILMEKLDGDLVTLVERRGRVGEDEVRSVFLRVVQIMSRLHDQGICHRDLKPDNFLIRWCPSGSCVDDICLTDFDYATDLADPTERSVPCGSPAYAAPEMCQRLDYDGRKVDIWSCGVLLFTLLCGRFPWQCHDMSKLFEMIVETPLSVPSYVSREAADLLHKMLAKDPADRPLADELLSHPFLSWTPVCCPHHQAA